MRVILLLVLVVSLSGCAGLGTHKRATIMPDEVWLSSDIDPQNSGKLTEITGGVKWKLR